MKDKIKNILVYVFIFILVVLIRTFIVSPARVKGESMEPTLKNKEFVFVNKIDGIMNNINRFDIVVIKENNEYLIKRVIGMEEEKVEYLDNVLYINNKAVKTPIDFEATADFVYNVPKDSYYCLGDNRDISKDSRWFGPFGSKNIKGTVNVVFFPFTRIREV
ncbi:MAG: signal peptidase I [Bacilli bacterium]